MRARNITMGLLFGVALAAVTPGEVSHAAPHPDPVSLVTASSLDRVDGKYAVSLSEEAKGVRVTAPATGATDLITFPGISEPIEGKRSDAAVQSFQSADTKRAAQVTTDGSLVQLTMAAVGSDSAHQIVDLGSEIVTVVPLRDGAQGLQLANGQSLLLLEPAARDSSIQRDLTTQTSFTGSRIEFSVSDSRSNDVTVQAGFYYNINFEIDRTRPGDAERRLKECFNCIFPIKGAPREFPRQGDILPLWAGPGDLGNFEVTFRGENRGEDGNGSHWWGYTFDPTRRHFHGEGSWIDFSIAKGSDGINRLLVFGNVTKLPNPWGVTQAAYESEAKKVWTHFADRLRS